MTGAELERRIRLTVVRDDKISRSVRRKKKKKKKKKKLKKQKLEA